MKTEKKKLLFLILAIIVSICLVLSLLICYGSKTTPVGSLNTIDLRHYLPADIASHAPSDSEALQHQTEVQVGEPSAKVLIRWCSFNNSQNAYLLSVSFEVIESAPGVKLSAGVGEPINLGTTDAVIEATPVLITWYRKSLFVTTSGSLSGEVSADGTWQVY